MNKTYTVQVGQRGVITFPKELRDQNHIAEGEVLSLIEISEGVFVLTKQRSSIDVVADKLAQEWQASGESLETMLSTLREIRAEYDDQNS